jgi:CheY-like chemotaxis protein
VFVTDEDAWVASANPLLSDLLIINFTSLQSQESLFAAVHAARPQRPCLILAYPWEFVKAKRYLRTGDKVLNKPVRDLAKAVLTFMDHPEIMPIKGVDEDLVVSPSTPLVAADHDHDGDGALVLASNMALAPDDVTNQPASEHDTIKILVVDDMAINRKIFCAICASVAKQMRKKHNITVTWAEAKDGCESVQCVTDSPPDLVLMDKEMPLMDGLEATRRIREVEAREQRSPSFICFVSASVMPEDGEAATRAGCDKVMPKPIFAKDLLRIVRKLPRVSSLLHGYVHYALSNTRTLTFSLFLFLSFSLSLFLSLSISLFFFFFSLSPMMMILSFSLCTKLLL